MLTGSQFRILMLPMREVFCSDLFIFNYIDFLFIVFFFFFEERL